MAVGRSLIFRADRKLASVTFSAITTAAGIRNRTAVRRPHNPTLHWTGPAEQSLEVESRSAPGRPVNVSPLAGLAAHDDLHSQAARTAACGDGSAGPRGHVLRTA